jgi:hypothetical protein
MKVIDLLNKIANGEEVPEKIKWRDKIWKYDIYMQDYTEKNNVLFEYGFNTHRTYDFLTDEVEIIEENNKIEKLDSIEKLDNWTVGVGRVDERNIEEYIHKLFRQQFEIFNKLNEIIDKINEMSNGQN